MGTEGIEPPTSAISKTFLEAEIIPFNYAPIKRLCIFSLKTFINKIAFV